MAVRYDNWYDREIAPSMPLTNFPKCNFCENKRRDYAVLSGPRVSNSRLRFSRVKATVRCNECGMTYTATRFPDSKRWTFYESE